MIEHNIRNVTVRMGGDGVYLILLAKAEVFWNGKVTVSYSSAGGDFLTFRGFDSVKHLPESYQETMALLDLTNKIKDVGEKRQLTQGNTLYLIKVYVKVDLPGELR